MSLKEWRNWKHVTKLDPDRLNTEKIISTVINSGTDAIIIGGTLNVTREKVEKLISKIIKYERSIPIILEPSNPECVTFRNIDYLFIPSVLNTKNITWISKIIVQWIKDERRKNIEIPWNRVVGEAYIVLNPRSSVAKLTEADTNLTLDDVVAYAIYAERYLSLPIVYIEYSGVFGNPEFVKAVSENIVNAKLFYGGGINSRDKALTMSKYATIVVGNVVYEDLNKYLETII
jgi:phosphoglycerol geranylgeranyltransferase